MRLLPRFLVLLILSTPAWAGSAWTREDGETFVQFSVYSIDTYHRLYRDTGPDFITGREIDETTIEAYAEHGLTEEWTLLAVLPFRLLDAGAERSDATIQPVTIEPGSLSAIGNVRLGARRHLLGRNFAIAGQIDLELPTGDIDRPTGLSTGYDALTLTPSIAAGKSFGRFYLSGGVSLSLRSDDFSNAWNATAEAGVRLFRRLTVIGKLDVVRSLSDGDVVLDSTNLQTGLFVDEQEYVSPGIQARLDLARRVGVHVGSYSASGGNNVPRESLAGAGLWVRW
jgi:hypothetical protein